MTIIQNHRSTEAWPPLNQAKLSGLPKEHRTNDNSNRREPGRMKFQASILLAAFMATAACSVPPPVKLQHLATRNSDQAALAFTAPHRDWPDDHWWQAYGDLQLDTLMTAALADSPDVKTAIARMQSARALAVQAGAPLAPSITGHGEIASEKQSYNNGFPREFLPQGWNGTGLATLDVNIDLDLWGRNRAALAAAVSEADAAEVDAAQARLILQTDIAATYAALAGLYAQQDIVARTVAIRADLLDLSNARVAHGLDTQVPAEFARARLATARAELAASREAIDLVRHQLAALIGAGPDRGMAITRPAPLALRPFGLPENLSLDLLGRRPDIVSARLRAEAAAQQTRAARADFFPNLNIMGFIGLQSLGIGNLTSNGSDYGRVGPALTLPLFSGGRLRGAYQGAQAEYARAVASYDNVLLSALREVADATTSLASLADRQRETRIALDAAGRTFDIAKARYQGKLATYLEELMAEDAMLEQRRADALLQTRGFILDIQMIHSLGGGYVATHRTSFSAPISNEGSPRDLSTRNN